VAKDPNVFASDWDFSIKGVDLASVARRAGSQALGATLYELEPGARWADLHFHHANEEMIVVLSGRPTLRTLEGSRELAEGELVSCPRGRPGAHCLENHAAAPARVLIISTMKMPDVVEYPEREDVFVLTEPPYTEGDPAAAERGRLLRVFHRPDAHAVPPDE
jgi:uncharacterized cupin superfamily protein